MTQDSTLSQLASACAARMPTSPETFHHDVAHFEAELHALLDAVRQMDDRFAFDRDGRPGALEAIRNALPALERDLFEAVLEDLNCELAATRETLYRVINAVRRIDPGREP
jgi:hypothetical protein